MAGDVERGKWLRCVTWVQTPKPGSAPVLARSPHAHLDREAPHLAGSSLALRHWISVILIGADIGRGASENYGFMVVVDAK